MMHPLDDIVSRREQLLDRLCRDRDLLDELTTHIIGHNERMTKLGQGVSKFCTRGCAHCCSMIFFVSPAEVEVITLYVLERSELLQRFLDNAGERELRLEKTVELYRRCQEARLADDPALRKFHALDIRCAFNHDGACFIYPGRPLSCSLYNSIVPAATCAIEPKSYETEEMRLHHGEVRQWLAARARPLGGRDTLRLDVSRKVLNRLQELT